MRRILDRIKAGKLQLLPAGIGPPAQVQRRLQAFASDYDTCRILIDDVIQYFDHPSRSGMVLDFAALPCITPPHAWTWIEGRNQQRIAFGWLIERRARSDFYETSDQILRAFQDRGDTTVFNSAPISHTCKFYLYLEAGQTAIGPLCCVHMLLGEAGRLVCTPLLDCFHACVEEIRDSVTQSLYRTLEALVRINCSNVELAERPIPAALLKKRRKTGAPYSVFKTLRITPACGSQQSGTAFSEGLHREYWVRGHWADYREKGLFGKIHGLFYFTEHKRGRPELGSVYRTYQIGVGA